MKDCKHFETCAFRLKYNDCFDDCGSYASCDVVTVKIRSDRNAQQQECTFFDSCFGACEWCETHDYSEACVPMLQMKVKQLEERVELEKNYVDTLTHRRNVLKAAAYEHWLQREPSKLLFWRWIAWRKAEPKMEG